MHGVTRFTADIDVWVRASPENASKVHQALARFGAPLAGLQPDELGHPGLVFQVGVRPNRIDILTSIDGVTFEEAWPGRMQVAFGDQSITVIGRAHLVANKRASGRPQDRLDVETLERGPLDPE